MNAATYRQVGAGRCSTLLLAAWCIVIVCFLVPGAAQGQSRDSAQAPRAGGASPTTGSTGSKAAPTQDSGTKPALEPTWSVYTNAEPQHKNWLRTGLETAGFLAVAEGFYYGTLEERRWYEYTIPKGSFEARFVTGDAYRFDNNAWESNVGHIAAGTGYYLLARTNDLGLAPSLLWTAGSSTLWELFGELRDEFSINDAIMTPIGGFAIGEPYYQLGEFFQHSENTIPNRTLGFLFGPSALIHRWLDCDVPKNPANVDKFGFTTDVWHRFRVFAGGGGSYSHDTEKFRGESQVGFDFEVITAEKFAKPGEASINYLDGVFNELAFKAAFEDSDIVDLRFFSKTAFLGHYEQNIVKDRNSDTLEGHSLFWGLGSAFEYYNHKFSDMVRDDKLAIVDLVGPTAIADWYHCGLHVRATAEAYPNFSMVNPALGRLYDETHDLHSVQSVYRFESYYYALGATAAGRLEMEYGPFGLDGQVRYHYFSGINGLDRFQDTPHGTVTHDLDFQDQRLGMQLTLFYALPIDNFKLGLTAEKIYRWSDIDHFSANLDESRFFGNVFFEF